MPQFETCEYCGANLDCGEICDCTKEKNAPHTGGTPLTKNLMPIVPRKTSDVKPDGRCGYGI